jgi:hypothetical protein
MCMASLCNRKVGFANYAVKYMLSYASILNSVICVYICISGCNDVPRQFLTWIQDVSSGPPPPLGNMFANYFYIFSRMHGSESKSFQIWVFLTEWTNFMQLSQSWEANSSSSMKEIPHILWKQKAQCSQEPATGSYLQPDEFSPQLQLFKITGFENKWFFRLSYGQKGCITTGLKYQK